MWVRVLLRWWEGNISLGREAERERRWDMPPWEWWGRCGGEWLKLNDPEALEEERMWFLACLRRLEGPLRLLELGKGRVPLSGLYTSSSEESTLLTEETPPELPVIDILATQEQQEIRQNVDDAHGRGLKQISGFTNNSSTQTTSRATRVCLSTF